ncbi:MAG: aminotransferase class V-fold PLP-dependent enzyme [Lachnospiraceae bacterium]|nr:aminotransferase class V-fold PLP-dependent enzyme [Lachnospiraceae bacterium]
MRERNDEGVLGTLLEQIEEYSKKGAYPFHMPGHKRNGKGMPPFFAQWFARDFTEIPGLDDLHAPEGILREAQERAASLYGAQQSFFLVNGSTAGVLAAVSAAVTKGGTILMQRASHRSAYHAVQLRELKVRYLYGRQAECGAAGRVGLGVDEAEVREAVERDPQVEAVFLTSPSYDGFSSDLAGIAAYLHLRNIPLIVDAAHGAHLGFSEYLPKSALQEGADVVVMSVHKTLPAPTQTALLHLGSERVPAERIQRFLSIYQTSSPSYLLMAAIDDCVERVSEWDASVWKDFYERRKRLSERLHRLKRIGIWDCFGRSNIPGSHGRNPETGKILVFPPDGKSGVALGEWLAAEGVQCEMALPAYVLLICTVCDTEEGYGKLAEALEKLDRKPEILQDVRRAGEKNDTQPSAEPGVSVIREDCLRKYMTETAEQEKELTIAEAAELPAEKLPISEAAGRISSGFVSVYPPGQPLLVPGETITVGKAEKLKELLRQDAAVQGLY